CRHERPPVVRPASFGDRLKRWKHCALLPEISVMGCGQLPKHSRRHGVPWTSWKDRCGRSAPQGTPHHSSCRRRLYPPCTQIRLGPRAEVSSLVAGWGGGSRDLSAWGKAPPPKLVTESSRRLPPGRRVFARQGAPP